MPESLSWRVFATPPGTIGPVSTPKASDILANQLREWIFRGDFPTGTPLPHERELVTQTHMSRATVREALRILEVQNLVVIKPGRAGGAFTRKPRGDSVATSVGLLVRGKQLHRTALLETRATIEPACAGLAARYRTDDDLAALEAASTLLDDAEVAMKTFLQSNIKWNIALAAASHNEILAGFMTGLSTTVWDSSDNMALADGAARTITRHAHRKITDAVRARNSEAAASLMVSYVHDYTGAIVQLKNRDNS